MISVACAASEGTSVKGGKNVTLSGRNLDSAARRQAHKQIFAQNRIALKTDTIRFEDISNPILRFW